MLLNSENYSYDNISIHSDETNEINDINNLNINLDNCQESYLNFSIQENDINYRENTNANSSKKIDIFIFYLFSKVQEDDESKELINDITSLNKFIYFLTKFNIPLLLTNLKTNIYHKFHFIGNLLGLYCRRCKHLTQSHSDLDYGKWKCKECEENDNICEINEEEVRQMIENLFKKVSEFFKE